MIFGYDLVNTVAEGNGPKVIKCWRVIRFGNQGDKGCIEGIIDPTTLTTFLNKLKEIMPKLFKKC